MANMLENYGLEAFSEDEDSMMAFVAYNAKNGKAIPGYYDGSYFYNPMGSVEFWVKTERASNGTFQVTGFDSHGGNRCIWEMIHSGIDITPKDGSKMERVIMFNRGDEEQGGLVPIELITADVLPSLMKDDKVAVQVLALPLDIKYYANEDEYAEAQPDGKDGHKWLIGNGSLVALSFLYNHSLERYEQGKDYETDRYVQFTATVKKLYNGVFEIEGNQHNAYIRCFVDTEYGELEFDHTLEQVPEEMRKNIKVGSIISGTCILSGDVAIREYENGIVKDFDHNLRLLRYSLGKGDPERMAKVLAPNVVYETDTSGKSYHGARSIIDRFTYIHNNRDGEYSTYFAIITEVDVPDMEYPVGTRCIVLADGDSDDYESIAFMTVDDNGMITKIKISTDGRYHFKIDE